MKRFCRGYKQEEEVGGKGGREVLNEQPFVIFSNSHSQHHCLSPGMYVLLLLF